MALVDEATNQTICESCPTMGNSTGVAGDEKGYLVGMGATLLDPPYQLQPQQRVT